MLILIRVNLFVSLIDRQICVPPTRTYWEIKASTSLKQSTCVLGGEAADRDTDEQPAGGGRLGQQAEAPGWAKHNRTAEASGVLLQDTLLRAMFYVIRQRADWSAGENGETQLQTGVFDSDAPGDQREFFFFPSPTELQHKTKLKGVSTDGSGSRRPKMREGVGTKSICERRRTETQQHKTI